MRKTIMIAVVALLILAQTFIVANVLYSGHRLSGKKVRLVNGREGIVVSYYPFDFYITINTDANEEELVGLREEARSRGFSEAEVQQQKFRSWITVRRSEIESVLTADQFTS